MPGLFVAQQVAGAAQFEILHGDVEAASERRVLRDGGEAVVRLLGHRLGRVVQEVGVRAFAATADAPAQLVQLGEAEPVGVVYDQRVRVEMSSPVSMIVVHTSTSMSRCQKSRITPSSCFSPILP